MDNLITYPIIYIDFKILDNIQMGRRAMREYEQEQEKLKIQKKNTHWFMENFDKKHRSRFTSSDIDDTEPPKEGETDREKRWRERKEKYRKAHGLDD